MKLTPKEIEEQKKLEGHQLIEVLDAYQTVVLLDEAGKKINSVKFANLIEVNGISSGGNMAFVIGGAYGFSDEILKKYQQRLSLSDLTFSHQMR